MSKITTVQQHILDQERLYPGATGDFTALLTSLTVAAKIISREVNKAGLAKIIGETGETNIQGEKVQKLDEFSQDTICRTMGHSGHVCVMASEESEDIIPIPDGGTHGKYVLMFDPLDGSSNIDVNASIGTIFFGSPKDIERKRRWLARRLPAEGNPTAGCGIFHLRLQHDDGVHHGAGRSRLHA
jgi:fructose-1,6-bisphosphatase I